ncbi:MAG TPA: HPr kinase/phosphatase C-terminal domain-containing protein, partial [Hyphomicrobiaceae bacterium]|nr:HPr kinase/phosphatase C-terminal domain-containing protein [Hyphomicrobiaceae bacterium]
MADHPGDTIHATAIAVEGLAVLIRGPSGAGKSELALRCMMAGAWIGERHCRARLVADDRVSLRPCGLRLLASAPAPITGRLEVRGVGLVEVEAAGETPVAAVVDL